MPPTTGPLARSPPPSWGALPRDIIGTPPAPGGREPLHAMSRPLSIAIALLGLTLAAAAVADEPKRDGLFGRDNLIAWCIVPFDSKNRAPEERAAMLERLGFKHFAYDWRA